MNYKEGYDWGKQSLDAVSEAELDARLLWKRYAGQTEIPCLYMATGCCPKRKKTDTRTGLGNVRSISLCSILPVSRIYGAYLSGKRARTSSSRYGNPCGRSDARNDGWEQDPGHVHRFRLYIAQPPSLFQ